MIGSGENLTAFNIGSNSGVKRVILRAKCFKLVQRAFQLFINRTKAERNASESDLRTESSFVQG